MSNEKQPDMPLWEDQLWGIMHAMLYRSLIALVPLVAMLFNPNHTPLIEIIRVFALVLAFGVALATIRMQQRILKQLKDKYGNSNNGLQAIGAKARLQPEP
jgi:hypothetical protein